MQLFLDPIGGIAGDMLCALLIDLGVPLEYLQGELKKLDISSTEFDPYTISVNTVVRGVFRCIHFNVPTAKHFENRQPQSHHHSHHHHSHHHHSHHHHSHHHHAKGPEVVNDGGIQRTYIQIREMISSSSLSTQVKENALNIFHCLALAEAKIHGMAVDEVQFHEVGALDSIVDIVGFCICIDKLNISEIHLLQPLPLSSGEIWTDHGRTPLPAPATTEILKGRQIRRGEEGHEQCTPTGAAIVAALDIQVINFPDSFVIQHIGYGAGTRDPSSYPNMVRGFIFDTPPTKDVKEHMSNEIVEICFQIDDMTGEEMGFSMEQLFEQGAVDVFFQHIMMKKNRPAVLVTVLCPRVKFSNVENCIFRNMSTFGFRYQYVQRKIIERRWETIQTQVGTIRIKIGYHGKEIFTESVEYEDLKRYAKYHNISPQNAKKEIFNRWKQETHK